MLIRILFQDVDVTFFYRLDKRQQRHLRIWVGPFLLTNTGRLANMGHNLYTFFFDTLPHTRPDSAKQYA